MRTEATDADFIDLSSFIRIDLDDDFGDLLSALFTSGFNYSVENKVVEEFVNRVALQGYRIDKDGEPVGNYTVVAVWEYRGGEWVVDPESTGLHRILKDGTVKIQPRTVEQLVGYVVERVNEWELKPIEDADDSVEEETIDDGVTEETVEESEVDEDLLDQLRKSVDNAETESEAEEPADEEQAAIEAPKSA
ncbi:hypothetical protein K8O93_01080 [Gordonia bronchialis]|uniref:hypothetical protein n=1 Tax=Gordonia bronchialis TaxID=2054 RepID=UPI001CBD2605|nr:hypothetical protein [Gordonia bronchialis]UAK38427.1 hypothetical protein K8O93_01080 [Gordonia bronchialis]